MTESVKARRRAIRNLLPWIFSTFPFFTIVTFQPSTPHSPQNHITSSTKTVFSPTRHPHSHIARTSLKFSTKTWPSDSLPLPFASRKLPLHLCFGSPRAPFKPQVVCWRRHLPHYHYGGRSEHLEEGALRFP